MNKRIVLLDETETKNYSRFFACGLGSEIYTLQALENMPPNEVDQLLTLGQGDGAMLVGSKPFNFLKSKYHFGIRNENYFDCSKLYRLSIEGGAFVRCVEDLPSQEIVSDFLSEDFAKTRDFSYFKNIIIKTQARASDFLGYLENLPKDYPLGYDIEASGMALDEWFEIAGFSLCTEKLGGYISLVDIRRELGKDSNDYLNLIDRIGNLLENRQKSIWTYNVQYEFQVSHRIFKKELLNLCDSAVFNVLGGNHLKRYSLKWTANSILGTSVWDTDFDRLSDLLDSMYFITTGKSKKTMTKVMRVTESNYKNTDEWNTICTLYPNYISEFELLISEYWGCPFMNIPADILGHYCNLDSFYTLLIYLEQKDNYSDVAINTYLDNARLGARLHSCGMYKDEEFRLQYKNESIKMMAWGITYCALARCNLKMSKHSKSMAKIEKYSPTCQKLIKSGNFYNGDPMLITKFILSDNIDYLDVTDTGLDEGKLLLTYGVDFATEFINLVVNSMAEVKMKTKIDNGIVRKKKILGIISEKLVDLIGLDKIKINNKHIALEKYIYYERAYLELNRIHHTYLTTDINTVPDSNLEIEAFDNIFPNLLDYTDYVSNNYFKCKSPIENDEIAKEFSTEFKSETSWLAAILSSTQQLTGDNKFYQTIGITRPEVGYSHFMSEWKNYFDGVQTNYTYPNKTFELAYQFWKSGIEQDPVKEIWTNFNGFQAQAQFFPTVKNEFEDYGKLFTENDIIDRFFFMRKFVLNYLLYKKYAKVLSTYIDGLFLKTDIAVIEDPITKIPIRKALPNEPGSVVKMFAKYEINMKSSKRWSSGYHTIVSHSDLKSTINTPPGHLLTYFDISSAEVKSAGFASGDPDLIDKFVKGIDIYVYTGKLYLPDGPWDTDPAFRGLWRKRFKTIFLGILYGLGKRSLAERLNCSEEEAEKIIEATYQAFPKLREYVRSQQLYPFSNNGYVNTFFGDKLQVQEWKYFLNSKSEREKNNLKARIERLGVNLPIQGGTSSAMASGFFNNLRKAKTEGWALHPIIVVHDSNTNYIPIEKLFEIREFYDKNFTDFCHESTGIKLLFDLLCGVDYETACEIKQLDSNNLEFSGSAHSLLKIVDKVMECDKIKVACSLTKEELKPAYITHPIDRFIREKGTSIVMDKSWYTIKLTKL